jgi:hypothetical protein
MRGLPTCHKHGAKGAAYGHLAWRKERAPDGSIGARLAPDNPRVIAGQRNLARGRQSERCHAISRKGQRCKAPALSDAQRSVWSKYLQLDIPPGVCQHHAMAIAKLRGRTVVWQFQMAKHCHATAKSTGRACRLRAIRGLPTCHKHGAKGAAYGHLAWRKERAPDGSIRT